MNFCELCFDQMRSSTPHALALNNLDVLYLTQAKGNGYLGRTAVRASVSLL